MRRFTRGTVVALLASCSVAPLLADDLSRWVWVPRVLNESERSSARQSPRDENPSSLEATERTRETIPLPRETPLDCPTLEQLGYRSKELAELSLNVSMDDQRLPEDCSAPTFQAGDLDHARRDWFETEYNWAASDLSAQPAYFDDPVLERYGQTRPRFVQPWLSGVHFFGQFPLLPYKMLVDLPGARVYTLGYYRPGSPTPCVARRLPRHGEALGTDSQR